MWWFLYGLMVGGLGMRLAIWDIQGSLTIAWYAWAILVIMVIFATLTLQHFFASFKELESRAAWMGLLFMGIPTVVIGGIAVSLIL